MTTFPASLDSFANPNAATAMDAAGLQHDVQHANLNDAVRALQVKVGADNSPDETSLDARMRALEGRVNPPDGAFKIIGGNFCLWDSGQQAYVPLTCVNGQLGVGNPFS